MLVSFPVREVVATGGTSHERSALELLGRDEVDDAFVCFSHLRTLHRSRHLRNTPDSVKEHVKEHVSDCGYRRCSRSRGRSRGGTCSDTGRGVHLGDRSRQRQRNTTSCSALPKARFSRFRRNPAWTFSLRLRTQPPDLVAPPRARSGEILRVSRETRTGDARRRRGRRVRGTRHACLRLFTHTTLEAWSSRGCPEAHRSSRTHWVGFYSLFT